MSRSAASGWIGRLSLKPSRCACWGVGSKKVHGRNTVGETRWRDLRIAVFGQKRLSREGGVEIVVKELCTRMAQQGCQVTCYNRSGHHVSGAEYDDIDSTNYEEIRQKRVPTIEKKGARDIIGSTKKNYDN